MKTNVKLPEEKPSETQMENTPEPAKPVHLDFSKRGAEGASPFQKAKSLDKRLKLFLWGDWGTYKTRLALQFPRPAVIDMEGGADLYGEEFNFDVFRATTPEEVADAIDWLSSHKHDFRTFVIDPVTVYWEALQKKWSDIFLKRNKGSKGYKFEFYDLQTKDWLTIKAEFKAILRRLSALDMNVIVTARQKTHYKEGSFMVASGETFDAEKSLPSLFDTVVRLYLDENGKSMAVCLKDRSNKLPKEPFEAKYEVFESLIGKDVLARKSNPIALATIQQKAKIQACIEMVGMPAEQVARRLASYNAESIDDLTAENAEVILQKLEAALAAKNPKPITQGGSHAQS